MDSPTKVANFDRWGDNMSILTPNIEELNFDIWGGLVCDKNLSDCSRRKPESYINFEKSKSSALKKTTVVSSKPNIHEDL